MQLSGGGWSGQKIECDDRGKAAEIGLTPFVVSSSNLTKHNHHRSKDSTYDCRNRFSRCTWDEIF